MFEKPTRNHISIIAERLGAVIVFLLSIGYSQVFRSKTDVFKPSVWRELFQKAEEGQIYILFGGLALILLSIIIIIVSFLRWRKTVFFIKGDNFVYERHTMNARLTTLPIENIATVNAERNVFERLVGTAKVKIDINSASTAGKTDFVFILRADKAEQLKNELLAIKRRCMGDHYKEEEVSEKPRKRIAHFDYKGALRHKLMGLPIMNMLTTYSIILIAPIFTRNSDNIKKALISVGVILLTRLANVVWGTLNLGDYTVECDDAGVHINYGMMKKSAYNFGYEKINGLVIKRPLLARLFGYCSLEVAVVGMGNERNEVPLLCLMVKEAQAQEIIKQCVPDFVPEGQVYKYSKAGIVMALWTALKRTVFSLPVLFFNINHKYLICGLVFGISFVTKLFEYISQSISYDGERFMYTKGFFDRKTGILRFADVQRMRTRTNFLISSMNAANLNMTILSSGSFRSHSIGFFDAEHFDKVAELVVSHRDTSNDYYRK